MRCPGALESQRDAVETTVAASEAAVEPHNPLTHPWPPATERPPANLHMGHDVGHASRPDWRLCARVGYSFDGVNAPARLEHPRPYDGPGVPQRCGSVLWGASVVPDAASIEKKHRETQRDGSRCSSCILHHRPRAENHQPTICCPGGRSLSVWWCAGSKSSRSRTRWPLHRASSPRSS